MGLRLHRDFVAEGRDHSVIGAQMSDTLIAVDHDVIAIERFCGDAGRVDDQRDRQRAGNNGSVAADGAFFEHDSLERAAIIQQFGRPDVAGDQDGIRRHFCPCF